MRAASILQRQNARTAKDSCAVNRGRLTPERARILGAIGARKAADAKRGKTSVPRCVGCLLAIGWGQKRIARHTGVPKTSVHRWAKFNGVAISEAAGRKMQAVMRARKRKAEQKNADLLAERARKKAERAAQPKKSNSAWYYANIEQARAYYRSKAKEGYWRMERGSAEHLKRTLRLRVLNAIKRQSRDTARADRKAMPTMQLTGCTVAELRAHLERQFRDGMAWSNMGKWHIDHIVPCAAFDLSRPDEQMRCFHYSNLQPLWARENLAKHDTMPAIPW